MEKRVLALSPGSEPSSLVWGHYLRLIFRHRHRIMICTALAMLMTFVCTKFLMTRWYQAVTVLRPASQEPQSSFSLGTILSSAAGGSGPLGNIFGPTAQDAQELLAILGSVDFNANLAERNKLAPILMRHVSLTTRLTLALTGGSLPQHPNRWTLYRLMQSRLDSTFEESTGNFMVKFIDPDPAQAKRILDLYVDSLRQKLRDRAIVSSEAAVKALEAASASTSDALMVGQLDQLLAQQIQELGTAEVQADFAFVVIDSPTVPPMPYFPRPIIFTLIAAILTPFLMCAWLILRERLERLSTFVREEEAVLREVESSRTASSAKYT